MHSEGEFIKSYENKRQKRELARRKKYLENQRIARETQQPEPSEPNILDTEARLIEPTAVPEAQESMFPSDNNLPSVPTVPETWEIEISDMSDHFSDDELVDSVIDLSDEDDGRIKLIAGASNPLDLSKFIKEIEQIDFGIMEVKETELA
ncbi:hypothetical protein EPUL_002360 [Erysiphe pulchra]|uniref:Uncharacterized protein n=1 Tax=Erysiphe pulchra TaxID=225359 RepID=A0A2S4PSQ5_9PEZI|nr:hypothetical protein EPUL_002360 [Erysiphe pulchra]